MLTDGAIDGQETSFPLVQRSPGGPVRTGIRPDSGQVVRLGTRTAFAWAVGMAGGLPVTIACVRLMTHEAYGSLAMATTLVGLLASVAGLGLTQAVAQVGGSELVLHGPEGLAATVGAGLRIARAMTPAAAAAGLAGSLVLWQRASGAGAATLVMLPLLILTPARTVLAGRLQALRLARPQLTADVTGTVVASAFALGALALGLRSAPVLAAAASAAAVGASVVLLRVGGRPTRTAPRFPALGSGHAAIPVRRLTGVGASMLISTLSWSAIGSFDVLIVGISRGPRAAGIYGPLSSMGMLAVTAFGALGTYLLTTLSGLLARGADAEAQRVFFRTSQWGLTAMSPILGILLIAPGWLLRMLFGHSFTGLDWPMRLLAAAAAVHILLGYNGVILEAHGRTRAVAVRAAIGLSVDVVACIILVPLFGYLGGALATLLAVCAVNASCSATLWVRCGIPPADRAMGRTVLAFGVGLVAAAATTALIRPPGWLATLATASLCGAPTLLVTIVPRMARWLP